MWCQVRGRNNARTRREVKFLRRILLFNSSTCRGDNMWGWKLRWMIDRVWGIMTILVLAQGLALTVRPYQKDKKLSKISNRSEAILEQIGHSNFTMMNRSSRAVKCETKNSRWEFGRKKVRMRSSMMRWSSRLSRHSSALLKNELNYLPKWTNSIDSPSFIFQSHKI